MPNPLESLTADSTMKFISSNDAMCTGNFNTTSHVDTVGRHLQPSLHPCTNLTINFFGNPRGGIDFVSVNLFIKCSIFIPLRPVDNLSPYKYKYILFLSIRYLLLLVLNRVLTTTFFIYTLHDITENFISVYF